MTSVHVLIRGRVQGVWYRGWTQQKAVNLGLNGWVRNRLDGSVEAVFNGPDDKVAEMLKLCKSGPPLARVDKIDQADYQEELPKGFHRRDTV